MGTGAEDNVAKRNITAMHATAMFANVFIEGFGRYYSSSATEPLLCDCATGDKGIWVGDGNGALAGKRAAEDEIICRVIIGTDFTIRGSHVLKTRDRQILITSLAGSILQNRDAFKFALSIQGGERSRRKLVIADLITRNNGSFDAFVKKAIGQKMNGE